MLNIFIVFITFVYYLCISYTAYFGIVRILLRLKSPNLLDKAPVKPKELYLLFGCISFMLCYILSIIAFH